MSHDRHDIPAPLTNPFNPTEQLPDPAPVLPTGPHVPSLVLGLLGLVIATLVFLDQFAGLHVDVARTAPWVAIGLGGVLLIVGALGIGRRRG